MKLLFCGDVVGRSGREAVLKHLPALKREHALDAVIVDSDNSAHGFGSTPDVCEEFFKAGVDVLTGGDHIWDQKEITPYIAKQKRLLRPHNFPAAAPGSGIIELDVNGKKLVVLHLLGQVFHREYLNSPFECAEAALKPYVLGGNAAAIFVDMHAEATSEKMAMGHFLDGRVSAVIGSHTHVPTADARILKGGTAYLTDAGMCGDYANTVIGFAPEGPMKRFLTKIHKAKMEPAAGVGTLCGAIVETDDKTGRAKSIAPVRLGGVLG